MKRFLPGVLVAVSLAVASTARAQDVATAEALFNKGVADMEAGKFETACPAIGESHRLDPRAGTLFALAECFAKAGRTASAAARYQDYLELFARLTPDQQAKQHGRERVAAEQKAALAPLVPTLTVSLAPDAPAGSVVKRDDVVLGGPSLGLPLPVDPGEHVVSAQAPNGTPVTEKMTLAKGEKKSIVLDPKPGAVDSVPASTGAANGPRTTEAPAPPPVSSTQRTAGFVVGGVGIAGLVLGAVTGAITLSKKSTITGDCDLDARTCRTTAGQSAVTSAQTTGLLSTVGFLVGGVGVVGGATLILTAPKKPSEVGARPVLRVGVLDAGPGGGSLGFTGTF